MRDVLIYKPPVYFVIMRLAIENANRIGNGSKRPATFLRVLRIGRYWGHTFSHLPHLLQFLGLLGFLVMTELLAA